MTAEGECLSRGLEVGFRLGVGLKELRFPLVRDCLLYFEASCAGSKARSSAEALKAARKFSGLSGHVDLFFKLKKDMKGEFSSPIFLRLVLLMDTSSEIIQLGTVSFRLSSILNFKATNSVANLKMKLDQTRQSTGYVFLSLHLEKIGVNEISHLQLKQESNEEILIVGRSEMESAIELATRFENKTGTDLLLEHPTETEPRIESKFGDEPKSEINFETNLGSVPILDPPVKFGFSSRSGTKIDTVFSSALYHRQRVHIPSGRESVSLSRNNKENIHSRFLGSFGLKKGGKSVNISFPKTPWLKQSQSRIVTKRVTLPALWLGAERPGVSTSELESTISLMLQASPSPELQNFHLKRSLTSVCEGLGCSKRLCFRLGSSQNYSLAFLSAPSTRSYQNFPIFSQHSSTKVIEKSSETPMPKLQIESAFKTVLQSKEPIDPRCLQKGRNASADPRRKKYEYVDPACHTNLLKEQNELLMIQSIQREHRHSLLSQENERLKAECAFLKQHSSELTERLAKKSNMISLVINSALELQDPAKKQETFQLLQHLLLLKDSS